jgi:hypothetical protein
MTSQKTISAFPSLSSKRPPTEAASFGIDAGSGIGNSNCCSKPNRFSARRLETGRSARGWHGPAFLGTAPHRLHCRGGAAASHPAGTSLGTAPASPWGRFYFKGRGGLARRLCGAHAWARSWTSLQILIDDPQIDGRIALWAKLSDQLALSAGHPWFLRYLSMGRESASSSVLIATGPIL